MRKYVLMIISILITVCISSCNSNKKWNFKYDVSEIKNIYIVDFYNFKELEIIKEIDKDYYSSFYDDVMNLKLNHSFFHSKRIHEGVGFLISYNNGRYSLIRYRFPLDDFDYDYNSINKENDFYFDFSEFADLVCKYSK